MSIAFEAGVAPSAIEARWRCAALAIPAAALALCATQMSSGTSFPLDGSPRAAVAAGLACAAAAAGLAVAALRALRGAARPPGAGAGAGAEQGASGPIRSSGRTLVVDGAGLPALRDAPDASPRAMSLQAWCTLPGLTVLLLAPYPPQRACGRRARPVGLVFGSDGLPDDAWRRLHVWLRWTERGRIDRHTLESHRP
jgi:hypothetical protein